ncbi:hypothetical protein PG984_008125 [Apiospora sp. TS-2023a]
MTLSPMNPGKIRGPCPDATFAGANFTYYRLQRRFVQIISWGGPAVGSDPRGFAACPSKVLRVRQRAFAAAQSR